MSFAHLTDTGMGSVKENSGYLDSQVIKEPSPYLSHDGMIY